MKPVFCYFDVCYEHKCYGLSLAIIGQYRRYEAIEVLLIIILYDGYIRITMSILAIFYRLSVGLRLGEERQKNRPNRNNEMKKNEIFVIGSFQNLNQISK